MRLPAFAKMATVLGGLVATSPALGAGLEMAIGGPAAQPYGQADFCDRYAGDSHWGVLCTYSHNGPLPLFDANPSMMDLVEDINIRINRDIHPYADSETFAREEEWIPAILFGDCEDIAMAKKLALHAELNIPMHQMTMATAWTAAGEGHAVLMLHTNRGVYVLDNLENRVMRWDNTALRYSAREHRRGGQQWVKIFDPLRP